MKLVVLIPAYNEETSIEKTILQVPRTIPGCDSVEVLVIDDGSTDKTVDMALNGGANKIVSHKTNMGVGAAFMTGIRNAISMEADIVVTIDGDMQLNPKEIPSLINPIMNNQFDVVIGNRFKNNIPEGYPKTKLFGNKVFAKIVSWSTGQKFSDTQSGFRAYSKDALLNISVINEFTYTQEVLIDLKFKGFRIGEIPTPMLHYRNDSKVVKSIFGYTWRACSIITKSLMYHRPIMAFGLFGLFLCAIGTIAKILTTNDILFVTSGLSTGFIILGVVSFMLGVFANLVFKRQSFTEIDLKHHLKEYKKD